MHLVRGEMEMWGGNVNVHRVHKRAMRGTGPPVSQLIDPRPGAPPCLLFSVLSSILKLEATISFHSAKKKKETKPGGRVRDNLRLGDRDKGAPYATHKSQSDLVNSTLYAAMRAPNGAYPP